MRAITKARSGPTGSHCRNMKLLNGTRTRSSAFSFIGESIRSRLLATNGIREICIEPGFDAYKHHIATYGPQDKFGYKDFIPMFKAEHFDPSAWAELFKKAGAKYVVPVAEHHDGFAMYDSGLSDWTAAKMGPHRDVIGDLGKAVRAQGLHFGVSSHRVEHDFFMGVGRKISSDVNDPQYAALLWSSTNQASINWGTPVGNDFTYVSSAWTDDWLARGAELVEKYHPDIVYFDWWIGQASIRPNLTALRRFITTAR